MSFCNKCGQQQREGAKFCSKCGATLRNRSEVKIKVSSEPEKLQTKQTPPAEPVLHTPQEQSKKEPLKPTPKQASATKKYLPWILCGVAIILLIVLLVTPLFSGNSSPTANETAEAILQQSSDTALSTDVPEPFTTENANQVVTEAVSQDIPTSSPTEITTLSEEEEQYQSAKELYYASDYAAAKEIFVSLASYMASEQFAQKCDLEIAHNYLKQNDLDSAAQLLFRVGRELYESGEYWVDLTSCAGARIEDGSVHVYLDVEYYFNLELYQVVNIFFDHQGNIVLWGKYYPESNGYEICQDETFVYDS